MMKRNLNDLLALVNVVREGSFTRAAARLGVTQSALSQAIRGLEERLQIRLLTRTTRSIALTPAGERLIHRIGSRFEEIETELEALSAMREKPAGTVRLTCTDGTAQRILLPKLLPLLQEYPDIKFEFDVSYAFRDIVAERFDAGVRCGNAIDKDMIAIPIAPPLRMAVAASPLYFSQRNMPEHPNELISHNCINQRRPTSGSLVLWKFEKLGEKINVRVDGSLIANTVPTLIEAGLAGIGIVFLPEDELTKYLDAGQLIRVLEDWCPKFERYHLYYPSRRQQSPAFSLVVNALRYFDAK